MSWWKKLKGRVSLAEPLKGRTTFKIGGPAKFFVEPKDPGDLKLLLTLVKRYNFHSFVIGRGSNLLISDKGINGVVLRLNTGWFNKLFFRDNYLNAGSGVALSRVLLFAKEHGLSGAEFLAGIPGTVGGALAMNAGIAVKSIGDLVRDVTVMDYAGNIKTFNKKNIKFGYRESNLSKYIILSTRIRLIKKNKERIKDRIRKYISYRKLTQDLSKPSAGCIFRNPAGDSAGRLIDLCGLKGKRIGGAAVSLKHANFILNLKEASSGDVCKLMGFIRKKVNSKFNINLTPEIRIWQK